MTATDHGRWKRIGEVFAAALAQPPESRGELLDRECGGDPELRAEVESLLAHHRDDDFLGQPATAEARRVIAGSQPELGGQRLGRFEVLGRLGAGGMGEVYLARDPMLERQVALKLLPPHLAADPDRIRRFRREALAVSALNHPNILTVHEVLEVDGREVLVSELIEGVTLRDRLRKGPLPVAMALAVATQIARGLEAAHRLGIVHRDVKPENVMIRDDGLVKVLDFGIAKSPARAEARDITHSPTDVHTLGGVILGTASYMSPEQARGEPATRQTDVWALGCVLYEALTGRQAFPGPTASDVLVAILTREPDWTALPADTPWLARSVLRRCLEKVSEHRLRDAGDAALELEEARREPAVAAGESRPRRRWGRSLAWGAAAGAGALTTAVLTLLVYSRYFGSPSPARQPTRVEVSSGGVRLSWTSTFTISPDGRHLVFAGAGPDGVERLWIRSLDAPDVRPLPGAEVALGGIVPPMFWSPDSRFVAFDAIGQLKRIDVTGGAPETVCALPGLAIGGSWNRDGAILVGTMGGIYRCAASGGSASLVTRMDTSRQHFAHLFPWFLPDGRRFLYLAVSREAPENSGIYVRSLDALPGVASSTRILDARFNAEYVPSRGGGPGHLLFMRDGELLAQGFDTERLQTTGDAVSVAGPVGHFLDGAFFSASTNGTLAFRPPEEARRLTWLDREGKVLGRIGELGRYSGLAVAPDGKRAVVVQHAVGAHVDQDLWLVDLGSGRSSRLTFDARLEQRPIWSADGKRIIYTAGGDIGSLFEQPVNGARAARLLLRTSEHKLPESMSPDGRVLLYSTVGMGSTRTDVFALPSTGEPTPYPVIRQNFDQMQAQFSPDGRWIAYVSSESGRQEVMIRPFSPASAADIDTEVESLVVSTAGGMAPRWRADGKELFFVTPERAIVVVDVGTSRGLQTGTSRTLFHAPDLAFQGPGSSPEWGVSADGGRFLLLLPETRTTPTAFSLILNWQAGLDPERRMAPLEGRRRN